MTKNEVRIRYKALRMALSKAEVEAGSMAVANRVLQLPVWEKSFFHVFLPIGALHEVDTELLLHILAGKDKNILVSKSDFSDHSMRHFLLTDATRLTKNNYGISEPIDGIEVPVEKIEVVFVPLLAFDQTGNRIGYGKGFYDRFLAKCRPETIKVGLSFFEAVEPWEDVFESDVRLDYCVTPLKVYGF